MQTTELSGSDLNYWVARANAKGSCHEVNVLRRNYSEINRNDPSSEPSARAYVESKFGQSLPDRSTWQ